MEDNNNNNNELAYDENYSVEYYTVEQFMKEYPDDYLTHMVSYNMLQQEDS